MTKLSKLLDHCGTQFEDSHDACLPAQPPYQVPVWELQRPLASQVRHRASEQDDQSLSATGLVDLAFSSCLLLSNLRCTSLRANIFPSQGMWVAPKRDNLSIVKKCEKHAL